MIMGSKKSMNKMKKKLDKKPLTLCNQPMEEVYSLKCLCDFLCPSLEESVHMTVLKRVGLAKRSIYEIRSIIEDKRADCLGGFNIAIDIWSSSVESMLWTNAETWVNMQKKTLAVLNNLYSTLYRCLF